MSYTNEHEYEFFDDPLKQTYYENELNSTSDYDGQQSASTPTTQYYSQREHIDFVTPAPPLYKTNTEFSNPKISKTLDSSQNQIFKIELEIVVRIQNDQNQHRTKCNYSSTLNNRHVNRMNPYRKPTDQNFRSDSHSHSYSSSSVPPTIYMQNADNIRTSFQSNKDLNESF
ncbi:hypothetical protein C1646_801057 [Rhizophagus diaphanus]|nr:hypothetical protein C1646_801057 [Rhizophagus diaphanus] [Rhizophagus sp. MUCL 43196]